METRHSGWMDKQRKKHDLHNTRWWVKRASSQCLRKKWKNAKKRTEKKNNMFYLKWIWESTLKKKDLTEFLGNQQRKEQACWGLMENISRTWGENLPQTKTIACLRATERENIFHRENRRKLGLLISTPIAAFLREGFRWNITQDNSNEEIDGFKIPHSWQHVNHEIWTQIMKNDIAPPQMIR